MNNTRLFSYKNFLKNVVLVLMLIVLNIPAEPVGLSGNNDNCSAFCTCYTWYSLRWASCSGQHLYSIHTGISDIVQALDISNNTISILADYELQSTGLTQLRYLNLSDNAINEIGLSAFCGLQELTVLDLSRNHLYYILPNTFVDNTNLRVLRLSGNNFNQHVPFLENPSITELNLASCRLSHLPSGAFSGLKRLRSLDLSDNLMIQLEVEALRVLPFLRILSINDNPWACNTKQMQSLQHYLTSREIKYEPSVCPRRSSVKKFEKIVLSPVMVEPKNAPNTIILPKNKNTGNTGWVKEENRDDEKTAASVEEKINKLKDFYTFEASVLCIFGFITGLGLGIIGTYCWLSRSIVGSSQRPSLLNSSLRRYDTISHNSQASFEFSSPLAQRVSLLRNIWSNSDEDVNNLRRIPVCPDTPPPAYRDVILHANRYPVG
ncbi:leucine-rich repeat-containing protein 24 [Diachasma alloeum]|uniref:leucine-rich repeat-containing protein 24 n=1 Tax=Diachasma alloeum TaxID=454923 RepID=UPI0007382502|nr:leucine-rich repeat-containing protein 24 [Diachasma alloeum]